MTNRHVVFFAGRERYALPLEAVREVVVPRGPFARVPRVSDAVRGVMNLRGRIVAVVDLAAMVGLAPQRLADGAGHVIVLEEGKRGLGLLVGAVSGVEPLAAPEEPSRALVRGVAAARGGAVTILAPGAVAEEATRLFSAA